MTSDLATLAKRANDAIAQTGQCIPLPTYTRVYYMREFRFDNGRLYATPKSAWYVIGQPDAERIDAVLAQHGY